MSGAAIDRIFGRVLIDDGCWEWIGYHNQKGYAAAHLPGRTTGVHRIIYELLVAPIPTGLTLDHLCRYRGCVNPWHLEPVTNRENVLRGTRRRTHCSRGHEYTPENTWWHKHPQRAYPARRCLACERLRHALDAAAEAHRGSCIHGVGPDRDCPRCGEGAQP